MKDQAISVRSIETLAKAKEALVVTGAPEGADAAGLAEAARLRGGVTLFVARDETRATQFEAAARFFAPELETLRLPAWDTLPYDRISPAAGVAAQR
jgi:transcription-repair coupling factor (superfamily II helicase)